MTDLTRPNPDFLLNQTEDGNARRGPFHGETAWLSLRQLAELVPCDKSVISRHITNVCDEESSTSDGKTYQLEFQPGRDHLRPSKVLDVCLVVREQIF